MKHELEGMAQHALAILILIIVIQMILAAILRFLENLLSNGAVDLGIIVILGLLFVRWWRNRNHDFHPF